MKFQLLDDIIEQTADRIVTIKLVSMAEEYLADHFPTFPVLPGVMMIESMVQAARVMLADRGDARLVLGEIKALKFSSMVRPGEVLEMEVKLQKELGDHQYLCKGLGKVLRRTDMDTTGVGGASASSAQVNETAVSGRFTMRPIRNG